MKKQYEIRHIVTDVVSIPVIRLAGKTEAYRQATKPGWGTVEWYSAADGYKNPVYRDRSDKTQELACNEDSSASLYTKNGGYFGIFPYDEIDVKKMPKQADIAAIIHSDSCGVDFWTQDDAIRIFVTYDTNGLIDTYRLEYGENERSYDGETEISFDDLYTQKEVALSWKPISAAFAVARSTTPTWILCMDMNRAVCAPCWSSRTMWATTIPLLSL